MSRKPQKQKDNRHDYCDNQVVVYTPEIMETAKDTASRQLHTLSNSRLALPAADNKMWVDGMASRPRPCRPGLAGEEGQRTIWGGQRGMTPIQPHKADSGAARTSPGRSQTMKQCASR